MEDPLALRKAQTQEKLRELWVDWKLNKALGDNQHRVTYYNRMFEYYTSLQLMERDQREYFVYEEMDGTMTDRLGLPARDQGIDVCDVQETIVQCKLRNRNISWRDVATFMASQNAYCEETGATIVRWPQMILARNSDVGMTSQLGFYKNRFQDLPISEKKMLEDLGEMFDEEVKAESEEVKAESEEVKAESEEVKAESEEVKEDPGEEVKEEPEEDVKAGPKPEEPEEEEVKEEPGDSEEPEEEPGDSEDTDEEPEEELNPLEDGTNTILIDADNGKEFTLRDYQKEAINLIRDSDTNVVIDLPTGTGKNVIISYSLDEDFRQLILVPRVILMDQMAETLNRHRPELVVQKIGGGYTRKINSETQVVICVYNSYPLIRKTVADFDMFFIDEAHHVRFPSAYRGVKRSKKTDYLRQISALYKTGACVYLSATIEEKKGPERFTRDLRDMIEAGYLSDYNVIVPVFAGSESKTPDKLVAEQTVCKYLVSNHIIHTIVYCGTIAESKRMSNELNRLQPGFSSHVDCKTTRSKRNEIIKRFKEGSLRAIVNCGVFLEGFDAPIARNIVPYKLPRSKVLAQQMLGRILRPHPSKSVANVILPCVGTDSVVDVRRVINLLAKKDRDLMASCVSKNQSGRIQVFNAEANPEEPYVESPAYDLLYQRVYENLGTNLSGVVYWRAKLAELSAWMAENGRRPTRGRSAETPQEKTLAGWINTQITARPKQTRTMADESIRADWDAFVAGHGTAFLYGAELWRAQLAELSAWMAENGRRPKFGRWAETPQEKTLAGWIGTQTTTRSKQTRTMADESIRADWDAFVAGHGTAFLYGAELWRAQLAELSAWMAENGRRPKKGRAAETPQEKTLAGWIGTQTTTRSKQIRIMADESIRADWDTFKSDCDYL
jgi:superfamily II DNA or RNA helicase